MAKKLLKKLKYKIFKDKRVGLIKLEGIIVDSGPISIVAKITESFKQAKKLGLKVIVLKINSPGGTVGASQEIYRQIKKAQEDGIKVIVSLGDVAASGGLYIAAGADKIISNPGTVTGSIGVIIKSNIVKNLYKKIGIDQQTIKSGPYKDILSPTKYFSKEEKQILQGLVDNTYEQFINVISKERKIDLEKVKNFADGRIFTGSQAKELKIVDELGSEADAIDIACKMFNIKEEPNIIDLSPKKNFLQKVTGATVGEIFEKAGMSSLYGKVPLWLMPEC